MHTLLRQLARLFDRLVSLLRGSAPPVAPGTLPADWYWTAVSPNCWLLWDGSRSSRTLRASVWAVPATAPGQPCSCYWGVFPAAPRATFSGVTFRPDLPSVMQAGKQAVVDFYCEEVTP